MAEDNNSSNCRPRHIVSEIIYCRSHSGNHLLKPVVGELTGESRIAKRPVSAKHRIASLGKVAASHKIDVAGAIMCNLDPHMSMAQYVPNGSIQYCAVYIGKAGCCTGICSGA